LLLQIDNNHESTTMNPKNLAAIALIVAGLVGLAYGGFSYTKDTTVAKLGSLEITAQEKQTFDFPLWASVGALVAGGVLLVLGNRKG
jgi:TRAP-type C4-dicarboxylate transport system permease small subunit